jgi:hypothetical protein
MHPIALVQEIDRLLKAGELSQRKIAERLGVSRGSVSAIAHGRRGLYGREPIENGSPLVPSSPPMRCHRCGYRVYLPCNICRVREHRQRLRVLQTPAATRRKKETIVKSVRDSNRNNS